MIATAFSTRYSARLRLVPVVSAAVMVIGSILRVGRCGRWEFRVRSLWFTLWMERGACQGPAGCERRLQPRHQHLALEDEFAGDPVAEREQELGVLEGLPLPFLAIDGHDLVPAGYRK